MPDEIILPDVQRECEMRMNGDPFFTYIAVINYRKGDIAAMIAGALGGMTKKNGRSGACVAILQPVANCANRSVRFSPFDTLFTFLVMEIPPLNDVPEFGTLVRAEAISRRLLDLFGCFHPVGVTTPFVAQEPYMLPSEDVLPVKVAGQTFLPIAYECQFAARESRGRGLSIPLIPTITTSPSGISIACDTGAVDIYYTLDGSPPAPTDILDAAGNPINPASMRYDGTPFSPTFSCKIRAGAWRQQSGYDWTPSDINEADWEVALAEGQGIPISGQSEDGESIGV